MGGLIQNLPDIRFAERRITHLISIAGCYTGKQYNKICERLGSPMTVREAKSNPDHPVDDKLEGRGKGKVFAKRQTTFTEHVYVVEGIRI